jgi:hypothetical protein
MNTATFAEFLTLGIETGTRVQLHPATDAWMSGDRFGTVVKIGPRLVGCAPALVSVKMDKSGRTLKLSLGNVQTI